jgi:glycosyltransferase involved in cell wall biosynthesis
MIDPATHNFQNTPASDIRPRYSYKPVNPNSTPQVTIVTPFYNVDPTMFNETARTILSQSFQQWEWLIINDDSNDSAVLANLATYRNLDPRISVIDLNRNQGPSAARNHGYQTPKLSL